MKQIWKAGAARLGALKGKRVIGILGVMLLLVALVTGSTFAWFVSRDTVVNNMENEQNGSVVVSEVFVEPDRWIPGQKVKKEVTVQNQGKLDVLVRVSFEEYLEKYGGVATHSSTPLSGAQVPVEFNNSNYLSTYGWLPPASQGLLVDSSVTTALGAAAVSTLLVREMSITAGETPTSGYSFVFWYQVPSGTYAGKLQTATADFYLDENTIKIAGSPKFYYYPPKVITQTAWAALMHPQLSPPAAVESPRRTQTQSASSALAPGIILFEYDQIAAVPTPNKWFYNEDDGYFYYIGKVAPNAFSPMLLKSVTLSSGADNSYSEMKYSLLVNAESIQNYQTALESATGWQMDPLKTNTTLITNAMITAGAFAMP